MIWTVLALFALVILGGFISYYGDLQGRRWGKRRVSWFGLRPKYTAIIITSLTGASIVLLSIFTVLIGAPVLRDVVIHGERAIRDNRLLLSEQTRQRRQFDEELRDLTARAELKRAEYQQEQNHLTEELSDRQYKLNDQQKRLLDVNSKLAAVKAAQAATEAKLTAEKAQVAPLQKEAGSLARQNRRAEEAVSELGRQTEKGTRRIAELERTRTALEGEQAQLKNGIARLRTETTNLQASNNVLRVQESELKRDITVLSDGNKRLSEDNAQLNRDLATRQARLDDLRDKIAALTTDANAQRQTLINYGQSFAYNYNAVRQGTITIRAGAELGRRVLDAHLRGEAVRRQLLELLDDASDSAQALKAGRGDNGRAVRIVSKRVTSTVDAGVADEAASLNSLAENLAGSDQPVVMVVNSVNNCVGGEQALVEISLRRVSTVFKRGEAVASAQVIGGKSYTATLNALSGFLQNDVRDAAIKAGTVPQIDPLTGAAQVGRFDLGDLAALADRMRRFHGPVLLRAFAAESVTSADLLDSRRLRFEIKPVVMPAPGSPPTPDAPFSTLPGRP